MGAASVPEQVVPCMEEEFQTLKVHTSSCDATARLAIDLVSMELGVTVLQAFRTSLAAGAATC